MKLPELLLIIYIAFFVGVVGGVAAATHGLIQGENAMIACVRVVRP